MPTKLILKLVTQNQTRFSYFFKNFLPFTMLHFTVKISLPSVKIEQIVGITLLKS